MPKPELNEFISQLSHQYTSLLNEVQSLKVGWWQKNYGSVIAVVSIVGSFFIAFLTQKWSYKNQKRLEEEKRKEEKLKATQDCFRRIYSELSSALMAFINKSIMHEFEKLQFFYFSELSGLHKHNFYNQTDALEKYQFNNSKIKDSETYIMKVGEYNKLISTSDYYGNQYKTKYESSHEKMMDEMRTVTDCFNKINELAHEYEYLVKHTEVLEIVKVFTARLNGYISTDVYKEAGEYAKKSNIIDTKMFMNIRDTNIIKSAKIHEETLVPLIKDIQLKFKKGTNV